MKRFSKFIQESIELHEKLKASDDMGDWVKDFQDSDAPQFKGKSQKKRQQMAVAAKLSAERNEEIELDEARIKVGDVVRPSKSSTKTMKVTAIERVPYMGRKETFVNGIDDEGLKIRRPLRSVIKEHIDLDEAETKYVIKHKKTKQVLSTHDNYADAKDEHSGLGSDKANHGIYKQTKKDAALANRNTYREEVELDESWSMGVSSRNAHTHAKTAAQYRRKANLARDNAKLHDEGSSEHSKHMANYHSAQAKSIKSSYHAGDYGSSSTAKKDHKEHMDKAKEYRTAMKESVELDEAIMSGEEKQAFEDGKKAARAGKEYNNNPHKDGKMKLAWSKGHNKAKARKFGVRQ